MSCNGYLAFHCLPISVRPDGNLAETIGKLGNMAEYLKPSQLNPGRRASETRGRRNQTDLQVEPQSTLVIVTPLGILKSSSTEMRFILCTWFGEFCSCCSLTA